MWRGLAASFIIGWERLELGLHQILTLALATWQALGLYRLQDTCGTLAHIPSETRRLQFTPQNHPSCLMSMCISAAQARATRAVRVWLALGLLPFSCKFPRKMALVTCPRAFRLHRLAQNVRLTSGLWHFTCKFPQYMTLVTCPRAFRLCRLRLVRLISGLRHFSCKFLRDMARPRCPSAFRLRRLAQTMGRGLGTGPPQHHHLPLPQHHHSPHHNLPPP